VGGEPILIVDDTRPIDTERLPGIVRSHLTGRPEGGQAGRARSAPEFSAAHRVLQRHGTMSLNPSAIRIVVVDDHPLARAGIGVLIAGESDMVLVGEAADGREAVEQFRVHRPDVTLMDLQLPQMSGLDAMAAICAEFPEARIIALTSYTGDVHVVRALQAGASGYLLKGTLGKELVEAIRAVHRGRKALSPELSFELAEHGRQDALSPAEVRVLRLIAEGNSNKEIAERLSVTEDAVKGQVRSILAKLRAHDRTHAAMIGLKRGIIEG
jgi:DNA-binding NarL/FixJ family response regulator